MKTLKVALQVLATGAVATGMAAHASLVTGYVWENASSSWESSVPANDGTVPTTSQFSYSSASAAGTLSGNTPLDFNSYASGNLAANYTISSFLGTGGYSYSAITGSGNDNLDNTLFEFNGLTSLTHGEVISVSDDDGVILSINGTTVISAPQPQSNMPSPYTYTWTGATGVYNFSLYYAEVDGAPADLNANLSIVPEPSSIVAGALLLLPFGISTVRVLRRKEVA
jgi:hypothetical protein